MPRIVFGISFIHEYLISCALLFSPIGHPSNGGVYHGGFNGSDGVTSDLVNGGAQVMLPIKSVIIYLYNWRSLKYPL